MHKKESNLKYVTILRKGSSIEMVVQTARVHLEPEDIFVLAARLQFEATQALIIEREEEVADLEWQRKMGDEL